MDLSIVLMSHLSSRARGASRRASSAGTMTSSHLHSYGCVPSLYSPSRSQGIILPLICNAEIVSLFLCGGGWQRWCFHYREAKQMTRFRGFVSWTLGFPLTSSYKVWGLVSSQPLGLPTRSCGFKSMFLVGSFRRLPLSPKFGKP